MRMHMLPFHVGIKVIFTRPTSFGNETCMASDIKKSIFRTSEVTLIFVSVHDRVSLTRLVAIDFK